MKKGKAKIMSKKNVNCMSYALDLERDKVSISKLDLWYSSAPFSEILEKCQKFHRTCRKVERDEELRQGEWRVVFFGFEILGRDYDDRPTYWDYHFAKQEADGTWKERYSIGEPITETTLEELIAHYKAKNLSPIYMAVSVED